MALLSTGLVSCNQDFETIFSPQTNPQESLLQASDVTVANNTPAVINLAEYFTEDGIAKAIPIGAATVKEGAMPEKTEWIFIGRAAMRGRRCSEVMEEMKCLASRDSRPRR